MIAAYYKTKKETIEEKIESVEVQTLTENKKEKKEGKRKRIEADIERTLWLSEEPDIQIFDFRDQRSLIIYNLTKNTVMLHDYTYEKEGGKGIIYYHPKGDVLPVIKLQGESFCEAEPDPLLGIFQRRENVLKMKKRTFLKSNQEQFKILYEQYNNNKE